MRTTKLPRTLAALLLLALCCGAGFPVSMNVDIVVTHNAVVASTFDPNRAFLLAGQVALSAGNLTATLNAGVDDPVFTTNFHSSGTWVFRLTENVCVTAANCGVGLATSTAASTAGNYLGIDANSVGIYGDGSVYIGGNIVGNAGVTFAQGAVIDVVVNLTAKTVQIAINGGRLSTAVSIVALSGFNLSPAVSLAESTDRDTFNGTTPGSYAGATAWDGSAGPPTITAINLSNGLNFNVPTYGTIDTLSVACTGTCGAATFQLATQAGCTSTNNSSFGVSGTNLTSTVSDSGNYDICLEAQVSGAANFFQHFTLSGANANSNTVGAPPAPIGLATNVPVQRGPFRYVSPSGNDGNSGTSRGSPWQHLSFACGKVPANSNYTIQLAAGTYTETSQCVLPTGVNIYGPSRDATTVQSTLNDSLINASSGSSSTPGNQTITGFTINGQNKSLYAGINVQRRNNVRIVNMGFTEIFDGAIWAHDDFFANPPAGLISGIEIDHNNIINSGYCDQSPGAACYGNLNIGDFDRGSIHDNTITDTDNGPSVYGGYGFKGAYFYATQIYNNHVRVTASNPRWGSAIPIELWAHFNGVRIYNNSTNGEISLNLGNKGTAPYSVRIYNNYVLNPVSDNLTSTGVEVSVNDMEIDHNYFEMSSLAMIEIDYGGNSGNGLKIHHNVFHCVGALQYNICAGVAPGYNWSGIVWTNVSVDHNVFQGDLTSGNSFFPIWVDAADSYVGTLVNMLVRNNIFMNTGTGGVNGPVVGCNGNGDVRSVTMTLDTNQYYNMTPTTNCTQAGVTFANSRTGNPQLNLRGALLSPFYQPSSAASPVVNAGINVGYPYLGSAPDIGAVEWPVNRLPEPDPLRH